jgi:hypothetical protein
MSSATSINKVLPPKGGSHKSRNVGPAGKEESRGFRLQAEEIPADAGFRVWHFFVLLSLIAATAAVFMAKQTTPEHLILISMAIGAAGMAAYAFYRMVAPLALADALPAERIGDRLRADLEREKTLVLRSIKELEFDRAMGKLSQQDFDEMAGRLRSRAIGIMKQLDGGGYRAIIERDLAARLRSTSRPDPPPSHKATADRHSLGDGGQLGRAPDQPPTTKQQQADANAPDLRVGPTGVCVCGIQHDADAKFCKACGASVA